MHHAIEPFYGVLDVFICSTRAQEEQNRFGPGVEAPNFGVTVICFLI